MNAEDEERGLLEDEENEHSLLKREDTDRRASSDVSDEDWYEEWEDLEATKKEDPKLLSDGKARGVSLIVADSVWLFFHYLQLFAVLQSLALRWTWPDKWLRATSFLFLFNLDVWEFSKFLNNSTYISVQAYYIPSNTVPIKYWYVLATWAGILLFGLSTFLFAACTIRGRRRVRMMVQTAQLQRAATIILEFICLPLGIVLARVFHCTRNGVLDIDNDVTCFSGIHWAYMGVALAAAVLIYILFPIWMIRRTRSEMLSMTPDRHEGYLQLKETEYMQGLDMFYVIGNFHLFSSFKKKAAYFRPVMFYLSFILFIPCAALNNHIFAQAVVINCFLLILSITSILLRPYRVTCFNEMLVVSYICLTANSLLGSMITTFNPYTLRSPYLTREYVFVELIIINGFWLLCFLIFVAYLLSRHFGCCKNCCKTPLWPSMTSDGLLALTPETRRYVRAVLKGRSLLDNILKMPPLFAPVHDLGLQIQVINVYCREAEYIRDPIHDTLWDLLDEMIAAHERIAPHSLYSDNTQESTKLIVEDLKSMMPQFVRRLAQREYDFILVSPVKRRLLFKMYIMGIFLNGRRSNLEKQQLIRPGIEKVWQKDTRLGDNYYEDIYPEREDLLPRSTTAMSLSNLSNAAFDDDLVLMEIEDFTMNHPVSVEINRPTSGRVSNDVEASTVLHVPENPGNRPESPGLQLITFSPEELEREKSSPLPGQNDE